jgi:extradiol dioxygenase family protein
MARLYADENFNGKVVPLLLGLGHDILTAQQAGKAGQGIDDAEVLAHAISLKRAVLTHNRKHFVKLHKKSIQHFGIIVCTNDRDYQALANRIHQALLAETPLENKLIRVNKPRK